MASEVKKVTEINVIDLKGKSVGKLSCGEALSEAVVRPHLAHAAVRWQRAKARSGTHSVLTRSNIKGGKKKPFKQKGTGRARAGSSVSPLMVGGAVVHGPTPRGYDFRLPRREKYLALAGVVSAKLQEESWNVVDAFDTKKTKSQEFAKFISALGYAGKPTLLVVSNSKDSQALGKAARNVKDVTVLSARGLNVYSLLKAEHVICDKGTWEEVVKYFDESKSR